jgi:hypothetical protein
MTRDGPTVERLRGYLQTLTPEAQGLLVTELERAVQRGDESAGNELILQELRRAMRPAVQPLARNVEASELFFAPLTPFLVEDAGDRRRVGRIARASLELIWEWIGRDLMPAEAKALSQDINRALHDDDRVKAEQLTRALHERAIMRIREAVAAVAGDDKARRRLAVQVGTPHALDDLATLAGVLNSRDVLAELARRLPDHIRTIEREHIESIKTVLEAATTRKASAAAVATRADAYLYGLVLVMVRLAAPWQLVSVASHAAESDDTARIAETPWSVAVTIVLGEVDCLVSELRAELKAHRPVNSLLKAIHDAARGLRTEMDLSVDSPWSRQLVAIRTEVSDVLKAEIESAPGHVRRLLRPRPVKEIAPGSVLDAIDVSDTELLVEFVGACRNYASELAVNEATVRSFSELQNYLETGTKVLLDSLRHAGDPDRPFRQSQLDAAIRFCRIVFGADYAGLLAKAAEIAVQSAAADRKAAARA